MDGKAEEEKSANFKVRLGEESSDERPSAKPSDSGSSQPTSSLSGESIETI